jgi:CheY-like chemotaxis protein
MAELLNLEIGLRSTIGKGSVFFVEVPIAEEGDEAVQAVSPVPATRNGGGNLILVVDDDRGVLTATEKLLRTLGYEVISAPEAEEAIELAKEWGKSLRLALLDYRLPNGWDGIRLAHRLCSELDRNLPVILITGDIAIGRLREVKLSELPVLHKPIDIEQLCGLMEEVAPRKVADQRTQGKSL